MVLGDFNCAPWSPHFRRLCGGAKLRDAARGSGFAPTWYPSRVPIGIPIDHVLVGPAVAVEEHRVGPALGSDHRPVLVDLRF